MVWIQIKTNILLVLIWIKTNILLVWSGSKLFAKVISQWFYLAIFEAVYGSHSQSKNGLYFPNFMYFSSYFPNFNKIFSQICRKR